MNFINHSNKDIWVGVYSVTDTDYTGTLYPWGARIKVKATKTWNWDLKKHEKVQVAIWNSGAFGQTIAQPRTVSTSRSISYAEDVNGSYIYNHAGLPTSKDKIQHIFVLMLENRSFDNVLGWLYSEENNTPPINIPHESPRKYDGLVEETYWNTKVASDHNKANAERVYAKKATSYTKPFPNPPEICPRFVEQMFGTETPKKDELPNMTGFIQAYAKKDGGNDDINGIMECYTPDQLPFLNGLAKQYAVSDKWFGSLPCETWPNRSMLHAGTSFGRLNNENGKYTEDGAPNFIAYAGKETIFDELDKEHIPYGLYSDSATHVNLLSWQFFTVFQKLSRPFKSLSQLKNNLSITTARQLPWYIFIEPEYAVGANDQHPNKNVDVRRADELIRDVYQTIRESPVWHKSALIITYDEHGGCFDHVKPPRAVAPDNSEAQFEVGDINPFEVFGPRVPTVVVSPYIEEGTVFRSNGTPHDHTSILATIRDMIYPNGTTSSFFTKSKRVKNAPTIWNIFTKDIGETEDNLDFDRESKEYDDDMDSHELSGTHLGLVASAEAMRQLEVEGELNSDNHNADKLYAFKANKIFKELKEMKIETVRDLKKLLFGDRDE